MSAVRTLRAMGATARIALLGPLAVDGGDISLGPRDRVVLTALATRAGEVVSSEQLADALWGERPPESWSKVVAGCVMRLRRALGTEAIETTPHGYRLVMLADDLDVARFEQSVAQGASAADARRDRTRGVRARRGAGAVAGRAARRRRGWEPSQVEATRLEQVRLDAEELRVDAHLQSGQYRRCSPRRRRWSPAAVARAALGAARPRPVSGGPSR